MTKSDMAAAIVTSTGMTKMAANDVLEDLLELMKTTLEDGEALKIAGFGNFGVKEKAARRGRNPQTGEEITIDSRKVLTFRPSQMLKKKMNAGETE